MAYTDIVTERTTAQTDWPRMYEYIWSKEERDQEVGPRLQKLKKKHIIAQCTYIIWSLYVSWILNIFIIFKITPIKKKKNIESVHLSHYTYIYHTFIHLSHLYIYIKLHLNYNMRPERLKGIHITILSNWLQTVISNRG